MSDIRKFDCSDTEPTPPKIDTNHTGEIEGASITPRSDGTVEEEHTRTSCTGQGSQAHADSQHRHDPEPRQRLRIWSHPRPIHILLITICLLVGIALITQVRAQSTDPLESLDQHDLVILLDQLSKSETSLRQEKGELESRLGELEDTASQNEAKEEALEEAKQNNEIINGLVPVHGQGITMKITADPGSLNAPHFVSVLGELRNSGAEAIELNGIRLTGRSWFSSDESGISVDGTAIESPYTWRIIGDGETMSRALEIPAGAAKSMRAQGASVTIAPVEDLIIDSVAGPFTPQWATPQ